MKLDLGCGSLKPAGYIGIDENIIDCAGTQFVPDVRHNLNLGIPFPDSFIDEVRSCHSLEHFKNPYFIMDEIYRVCKNGAFVIIIVPLFCDWPIGHLTCFYPDWFERNMDMNKFNIFKKEIVTRELNPPQGDHKEFIELDIILRIVK